MRRLFWIGIFSPAVALICVLLLLLSRSLPLLGAVLFAALCFLGLKAYHYLLEHPEPTVEGIMAHPGLTDFFHGVALGSFILVLLLFAVPALLVFLDIKGLMPAGW